MNCIKRSLTLLLTCCATMIAYSQKIGIGVYGGTQFNTSPSGVKDYSNIQKGSSSLFLGAKLTFDISKVQVGLSFEELGKHSFEYDTKNTYAYLNFEPYRANFKNSSEYYTFNLFANYKIQLPKLDIYIGPQIGQYIRKYEDILATAPYSVFPGGGNDRWNYGYNKIHRGMSLGGQAGVNVHLIKGLSIGAEVALRHVSILTHIPYLDANGMYLETNDKESFLYFPLSVGIHYQFWKI